MTKKSIIIIRVTLWLILAIILGWFGYMKIVPSGKISYVYNDFTKPSFFIGKLSPAERVVTNQGGVRVRGDPVYFSLRPPRRFEQASVTVKFKNTTIFPVMEIGLLNDKIAWGYDLKPLENKIIEQLALVWPVVYGQDGSSLIEREKNYDTVENFLSNLPSSNKIVLYNYNLKNNFLFDKYEPEQEKLVIDYRFRGFYQFYTYIKNEDLYYVFNFTDLNINRDDDPVEIKIYSSAGLIYAEKIADVATNSERQASIKITDLKEAVYRLSFIANDDIITNKIVSGPSQFALINKVWLADNNKKNLVLYSNSHLINAQTINPASTGIIKVGENSLDLNQTYKQISLKVENQPVKIELAKDDIIISGDGVFSFNEAGLLDPRLKNLDKNIDINQAGIDYILTKYNPPLELGEWQVAMADFDLTKAYQENGKYQFLLSIPGLKAEEPSAGALIIKEIKIDLVGTSLRQKFNKYFNK